MAATFTRDHFSGHETGDIVCVGIGGVFDPADETYSLVKIVPVSEGGIEVLIDEAGAWSAVSDEYARLTGEPTPDEPWVLFYRDENGEFVDFDDAEPVAGSDHEGIANVDGKAVEFYFGRAIGRRLDG